MKKNRLLVLYGSQTFTAQEIAQKIWRNTKALCFTGPVLSMDDYQITNLIHEEFVLFVCSTTGKGDEPDNMKNSWKFLLRKSLPPTSLVKMKFAVIGLGDSSYPKFNFVAKKLFKRLLLLGAEPLLETALCDYQHDLGHDAVMLPWLKNFYTKLKLYFPTINPDNIGTEFIPRWSVKLEKTCNSSKEMKDMYFECSSDSTNNFCIPIQLQVKSNVRTTSEDHFQDVRLINLKTTNNQELNYKPGDIFNIRPRNSKEDIEELFEIFDLHNMDIKPHYRLIVEEMYEGKLGRLKIKYVRLGT